MQGITREAKEKELASKTAVMDHSIKFGHNFDPMQFDIHQNCSNYTKLAMMEMLHINDEPHSVNFRRDVENLNVIYANILRKAQLMKLRK